MVTLGGSYVLNEKNSISGELAYSNADANTFSDIDNADNDGEAFEIKYQNNTPLDTVKSIISTFSYEFAGKNFSPIERYRPVEFNRDWNILSLEKTNEHYAAADFNVTGIKALNLNINSSAFIRQFDYNGFKQALNGSFITERWMLKFNGSFLTSKADTLQTQFFRPSAEIARTYPVLHSWKTGVRYEGEHNTLFEERDSLLGGSFYYDQYEAYIQNADTAINKFGIRMILRDDKLADSGVFRDVTRGITYALNGAFNKKEYSRFSYQLTYRTLDILDTSLTALPPENSLLGRLQHSLILEKGFITSDIFYEIGTGREPKREYTFVEVQPGQGVYTWNDYNNNGIPELNEFEISAFTDEANYIQVFIPTDEYVQSNTSNFTYALNINPKAIWFDKDGMRKFIARFAGQSSLQLNKKVLDEGDFNSYNPFAAIDDSVLVSENTYFLNSVFFNRNSTVFGIDYTYQLNNGKTLIVNGPESRGKQEHKLQARYKIVTPLTANFTYVTGVKDLFSEAFPLKNYSLPYFSLEPKLNFISGSKFRISGYYQFTASDNREGAETLKSHEATLDIKYTVVSKSTITSKVSFVKIDFSGLQDSPVGYAMLEGLQDGNNILWSVSVDRKLSQVLQLNLTYDGRKTGDAAITHVGRVQMRAIF